MAKITFITRQGAHLTVEAAADRSVMDAAIKHDIDGIEAECGGACACATCHIHVDPEWWAKLAPPEEAEIILLQFAAGADRYSRLSCQIPVTEALDGLVVTVGEN